MPEERPRSSNTKVNARRMTRTSIYTIGYLGLALKDAIVDDFWRIWDNVRLFFGSTLLIIGIFGFESARYCDGSPEDTFTCTRPSTYYYFDTLDILLIVLGVFLIVLWYIKWREYGLEPYAEE